MVHGVLVLELGVAGHERAFFDHVVDASKERIGGCLEL
jgi:hypothetical protein